MIVSILQLMGFSMGKPVHSRAEETPPTKPTKSSGTTHGAIDNKQANPARRDQVTAKSGKDNKSKTATAKPKAAAKPAAKPVKPVAKTPAKTAAKPVAKAKPATKAAVKPAAKPVKPAKVEKAAEKPAAKVAVKKAVAKPVAKSVAKPVAKAAAKTPAKVAAKPVSKPATKPAPVKAVTPKPVSAKSVAPIPVAVKPVVKPQAPAKGAPVVAPAPVAAKPVLAPVPPVVPQKAGRPSSRLAQLTVPSMAQSVASTAAKASYSQSIPSPVIVPALPSSIKKDPKLANNWKTKPVAELTDAELMAMPDSEYMNDVQMAAFRLKLTALKRDILNSAGETTEHLREDTSVVPDPADRATIEEEHALELRTRDRERKLLKKIEQSIARIDAGDYGYCDETGEPIGVGRLLARPTATLSLEAQQRRELKQKMFGD